LGSWIYVGSVDYDVADGMIPLGFYTSLHVFGGLDEDGNISNELAIYDSKYH
jgi:hypothetical protein